MEESPFIVKPSDQVSTDHGHTTAGRKGEFSNDVVKGVEVRVRIIHTVMLFILILIQTLFCKILYCGFPKLSGKRFA